MAYDHITYELLLDRMLNRIPNSLDKREGSLLYNSNAPAAAELQELYIQLDNILNETFIDTCSREYLLKRMSERGLYPNPATKAVLKCVITPSNIPDSSIIGHRFNIDNLNYICVEFNDPSTRDGLAAGEFKIECETAGDVGNYPIGNLIVIGNEIEDMQSAVIPSNAVLIRGDDEEETESCRQKYYDSLNTTTFGGNIEDYKHKIKDSTAMGVAVGAVKVFPNTDASGVSGKGGHVRIFILDSDLNIATSELIGKIQDKIDPTNDGSGMGIAPIGHIVHIDTTTEEKVYVKLTGSLVDGITFDAIKTNIEDQIKIYINLIKQDWENQDTLLLNAQQLYSYIASVTGFEELITVKFTDANGTASYDSISVTGNKIPSLENVTFIAGV